MLEYGIDCLLQISCYTAILRIKPISNPEKMRIINPRRKSSVCETTPSPNRREGVFSIYLLSCSLLCNLKPCSYFPLECINLTVQTSFFPMLRLSRGCDRVLACCILSHQALFPPRQLYAEILNIRLLNSIYSKHP